MVFCARSGRDSPPRLAFRSLPATASEALTLLIIGRISFISFSTLLNSGMSPATSFDRFTRALNCSARVCIIK